MLHLIKNLFSQERDFEKLVCQAIDRHADGLSSLTMSLIKSPEKGVMLAVARAAGYAGAAEENGSTVEESGTELAKKFILESQYEAALFVLKLESDMERWSPKILKGKFHNVSEGHSRYNLFLKKANQLVNQRYPQLGI